MNKHLSNLKIYFFTHKSFVISLVFILLLLVTFIKVNNIQIRLSDNVTSENIAPVDYSVDRNRFLCYAKKAPVDVQKTCDITFPKNKDKEK